VKSEFLKGKKNSKMQNSAKPPSELKLDGDNAAEWSFFVQKLNIYLQATKAEKETEEYSPTETLVEFGFGCKFMLVT
jgi:hypothetical protein